MSYLPDHAIVASVKCGDLKISPFDPNRVQPSSLDLTLSQSFVRSPTKDPEHIIADTYSLNPMEFALGSTIKYITLPRHISGNVCGKSSIGRTGLFIHNAGFIDPGFYGRITLELFNASSEVIELKAGQPICQIRFDQHQPCIRSYADKGGKYCGQEGATVSRGIS